MRILALGTPSIPVSQAYVEGPAEPMVSPRWNVPFAWVVVADRVAAVLGQVADAVLRGVEIRVGLDPGVVVSGRIDRNSGGE
jgi:hypothetical protein